jgi:DNA-binding IscR family transcriptional regulator
MVEARNAIANVLDNRTLAELRTLTNPSELAAMYHI